MGNSALVVLITIIAFLGVFGGGILGYFIFGRERTFTFNLGRKVHLYGDTNDGGANFTMSFKGALEHALREQEHDRESLEGIGIKNMPGRVSEWFIVTFSDIPGSGESPDWEFVRSHWIAMIDRYGEFHIRIR